MKEAFWNFYCCKNGKLFLRRLNLRRLKSQLHLSPLTRSQAFQNENENINENRMVFVFIMILILSFLPPIFH